jgi:hypothetical protein
VHSQRGECFSNSKARPLAILIFHRKIGSIEAHLPGAYAALAVSKRVDAHTGIGIRQSGTIRSCLLMIKSNEAVAEPEIPVTMRSFLRMLSEQKHEEFRVMLESEIFP